MTSLLLRRGHIYSPDDPFATAMLVVDGHIGWIGDDTGADVHASDVHRVVDLEGAFVAPAFVDAHVHLTATGLTLTGADLAGSTSRAECLARLRDAIPHASGTILGHGWDESSWSDARPPSTAEIDAVVGDRPVYLSRVDVHSAVASTALRAQVPGLVAMDGWSAQGPLTREAHHAIRERAFASVPQRQRDDAQHTALRYAARHGIASVHENAGPTISGADDLTAALALGRDPGMPEVIGYWGELHGQERADALGALGAAGDLFADGSLGSHTACLRHPYSDGDWGTGAAYLSAAEIASHVVESTRAGQQAGFHVIGDAATDAVVEGLRTAETQLGAATLRAARHRLEHLEMPDDRHLSALADLGVVASVQPLFDAAWGGDSGMYAERLGAERSARMNPWATMLGGGVALAFGSDAPVTPLDPWAAVRAAAWHTNPAERISVRAAFAAHTRGGRRAARAEGVEPGVLSVGAPATYAVWEPCVLAVQAPDGRIAQWSTDPRSGTAPLPDLSVSLPTCWLTVRAGHVIHDAGALGDLRGSA